MSEKLEDILRGCKAIAEFIGEPETKTYRMIEKKIIPAGKAGNILIASKRRIAAALDKIAAGGAA